MVRYTLSKRRYSQMKKPQIHPVKSSKAGLPVAEFNRVNADLLKSNYNFKKLFNNLAELENIKYIKNHTLIRYN